MKKLDDSRKVKIDERYLYIVVAIKKDTYPTLSGLDMRRLVARQRAFVGNYWCRLKFSVASKEKKSVRRRGNLCLKFALLAEDIGLSLPRTQGRKKAMK